MKFILVNGRTPRPECFCTLCCESIGESYLRDLSTRSSSCDHTCHPGHGWLTASALEQRTRAS
jgi:hypothetical protein